MTTRRDVFKLSVMAVPAALGGAALLRTGAAAQDSELSGNLTLWHGWTGAEADTLNNDILPAWLAAHPDAPVEALAVPFDQLKAKYNTEAATGGGPDLLIGPLDWVGELATSETIKPLDDVIDPEILANYLPTTVEALTYDGQLYGMPESFETVALYYNTDLVQTPPKTTAEIDTLAAAMPTGTYALALYSDFYHPAGYLFGYGAQLFDAENNSTLNSPETGRLPELDSRHDTKPATSSRTTTPPSPPSSRRARRPWSSTARGRSATTRPPWGRERSASRRCRPSARLRTPRPSRSLASSTSCSTRTPTTTRPPWRRRS
jgi:ABC-type glycerol-3-phosphate transport system substrate-binding protein